MQTGGPQGPGRKPTDRSVPPPLPPKPKHLAAKSKGQMQTKAGSKDVADKTNTPVGQKGKATPKKGKSKEKHPKALNKRQAIKKKAAQPQQQAAAAEQAKPADAPKAATGVRFADEPVVLEAQRELSAAVDEFLSSLGITGDVDLDLLALGDDDVSVAVQKVLSPDQAEQAEGMVAMAEMSETDVEAFVDQLTTDSSTTIEKRKAAECLKGLITFAIDAKNKKFGAHEVKGFLGEAKDAAVGLFSNPHDKSTKERILTFIEKIGAAFETLTSRFINWKDEATIVNTLMKEEGMTKENAEIQAAKMIATRRTRVGGILLAVVAILMIALIVGAAESLPVLAPIAVTLGGLIMGLVKTRANKILEKDYTPQDPAPTPSPQLPVAEEPTPPPPAPKTSSFADMASVLELLPEDQRAEALERMLASTA